MIDADGDDHSPANVDCDDEDATIHPEAGASPVDVLDANCNGEDDTEERSSGLVVLAHPCMGWPPRCPLLAAGRARLRVPGQLGMHVLSYLNASRIDSGLPLGLCSQC